MFEASPFVVIFQYAFIAAFPLVGLVVVTKWVVDDWKKSRRAQKKSLDTYGIYTRRCTRATSLFLLP